MTNSTEIISELAFFKVARSEVQRLSRGFTKLAQEQLLISHRLLKGTNYK